MFDWLFQPFPLERGFVKKIKSAALGGVVVFLALFLLRPFGANAFNGQLGSFALLCFQYGLVTFFTALLHSGIGSFFEKKIKETDWVVWKNILSTLVLIVMIGVANWLFTHFAFGQPFSFKAFWYWLYVTFVIGLIPTLVGYFLYLKNLLKKYTSGANVLNQGIQDQKIEDQSASIILKGENKNEELNLKSIDLKYIESANNYVEVNFSNEKKLLRSTLKKMETQLNEHSEFYRCHKKFIVNLNQVEKISGNAQGYKLHLKESDILIPVSRSLNEEISKKFAS